MHGARLRLLRILAVAPWPRISQRGEGEKSPSLR